MNEQNYKIKIEVSKDEIEIECEGDKEFVEKHIKEFMEKLKITEKVQQKITPSIPETLGEYYNQIKPKGHYYTALAFAYWLKVKENKEEFQPKDINNCYNRVKRTKSTNIATYLGRLIGDGHLAPGSGGKGWYKLTSTGEEEIKKLMQKSKE